MRFVKTRDLKPGMRLAKPIYNKLGVMLYERDTKLNAQGIESIKRFNLIGIYILEPAEPVPPLSEEDLAFEQFQTVAMFQLRSCMEQILDDKQPEGLQQLVNKILNNYGSLDHKLNFTQNIRSSGDYTYKHALSTAILAAMISNALDIPFETKTACVTAALLYDIGYMLVPPEILDKGNDLLTSDQKMIQEFRRIGFEKLSAKSVSFSDKMVSKMISQILSITNPLLTDEEREEDSSLLAGTRILHVADAFDSLTSMSLDKEPVSEMIAIRHLFGQPDIYDPRIVNALSTSINILPTGCCVDLNDNEKGMIIMENAENFQQPLILKFSDNQIYDLRDPKVNQEIQIKDIMKTMDNRIIIDEESLKHFYADEVIKKAADNFRKKKEELVRLGRYDIPEKPRKPVAPATEEPPKSFAQAAANAAETAPVQDTVEKPKKPKKMKLK